MNNTEIVNKIIGPIGPVGETNQDERRFENLKNMCVLVDELVQQIDNVACYNKDRVEYSMKQAGEYAFKFLKKDLGITE